MATGRLSLRSKNNVVVIVVVVVVVVNDNDNDNNNENDDDDHDNWQAQSVQDIHGQVEGLRGKIVIDLAQ